jgi:hypothetical protein
MTMDKSLRIRKALVKVRSVFLPVPKRIKTPSATGRVLRRAISPLGLRKVRGAKDLDEEEKEKGQGRSDRRSGRKRNRRFFSRSSESPIVPWPILGPLISLSGNLDTPPARGIRVCA